MVLQQTLGRGTGVHEGSMFLRFGLMLLNIGHSSKVHANITPPWPSGTDTGSVACIRWRTYGLPARHVRRN